MVVDIIFFLMILIKSIFNHLILLKFRGGAGPNPSWHWVWRVNTEPGANRNVMGECHMTASLMLAEYLGLFFFIYLDGIVKDDVRAE